MGEHHAAIKRLAEVELPDGSVPFASLRVRCPCIALIQYGADGINHWYDREGCKPCYLKTGRHPEPHKECVQCKDRNWVPEPDVEKAVERIIEYYWLPLVGHSTWLDFVGRIIAVQVECDCSFKEAVLRAAESWIKEQDESPNIRA